MRSGFTIGANLPWVHYGTDFGANAWCPDGGLSSQPQAQLKLAAALERLALQGVSDVRVFLLCDGRAGIRWDPDGCPGGLDEFVAPDLDVLLTLARRHRLRVMLVLTDFLLCRPAQFSNGVQLGGRASVIRDPHHRHAFIERVLRPLLGRFGRDETISAWDLFNEPEWAVTARAWWRRPQVSARAMRAFLTACAACIRSSSTQAVTVGCAHPRRASLVRGLDLDFYQVHWYESFGWDALVNGPRAFGGDRPVLLGECAGRDGQHALADVLAAARASGYAGAFIWSVLADDVASAWPDELPGHADAMTSIS